MPNFRPKIVSQQSKFHDFILARYTPLNNPIWKYKSANLLYKTFYIAWENDKFNDCIIESRKVLWSEDILCIAKFKKIYFHGKYIFTGTIIHNL